MHDRNRRRSAREKGGVLLLVALAAVVLMGFMGLAFDTSYVYFYKRRMQTAADAGALAGAQELLRGTPGEVTVAARKDAALNAFQHGLGNINVAVNQPPLAGTRAGNNGFVEVVISQPQPTWFLRVLGVQNSTIRARAVAGLTAADSCAFALNKDTSNVNNGFFANGSTATTFNCGISSNSHFRTVGGGCVVTPNVSYTGTYTNASSADGNCGPENVGQSVPVVDPLVGRYSVPPIAACDHSNYKVTTGTLAALTPGTYCGGIELGGSLEEATFAAGAYVLVGGGLKISSGVRASGNAVTFFNTYPGSNANQYDEIVINTTGTVSFVAPTSGPHAALLFYQDPRVTWSASNGSTVTAGANSSFQGVLYFPSTDLTYAGNSSTTLEGGYTILIAYNLKIAGNAQVNADYSSLGGLSPLRVAAFVE